MIEFSEQICTNLEQATKREWLETNGLGGFACSTLAGINTRRYHALLTAATKPPVGRMVLLSKFEEVLIVNGEHYELSANQYPGAIHPRGFSYLTRFRLDPFPVFTFAAGGVELEKTIFMLHGENTTAIEYRVVSAPASADVTLELLPLVAFRDYHSLTHENSALRRDFTSAPGVLTFQPYDGVPELHLAHNAQAITQRAHWYRNFEYSAERERGLDFAEDLFNPCSLTFAMRGAAAVVIASTEIHRASDYAELRQSELKRRRAVEALCPIDDPIARQLTTAADQYIVARGDHKTIIAGYPWFSDWGRDSMIALPGLTLATGRFDIARDLLRTFAQSVDRGMLPNRFPDAGEQPEYNTVDATLWFFEAIRAYADYTGDFDFVRRELYSTLSDIVAWHIRGTRYGIRVDATGLLYAGEPGVQLTWMDAKVGDWVVTPRHGKPVEIQALWYNALRIMEEFARRFGDVTSQKNYANMATFARWSFNHTFWNHDAGCLYDVTNGGPPDPSIRPNQIFAASLHHSMLSDEAMRSVVDVVERELFTAFRLRSLAPSDPRYCAHYEGDVRSRDSAYHQGTVWPWLLGPFITAYVRSRQGSTAARQQAADWIGEFAGHFYEAGLGQISEIFDADAPHTPRGCFAQAWSVAELLRSVAEDVYVIQRQKPSHTETSAELTAASALELATSLSTSPIKKLQSEASA
jgi:predicted glycogen debranching enzyme